LFISSATLGDEKKAAANSRITIGAIGSGNMGMGDIRGLLGDPRVQVVAVCDVNRKSDGYWNGAVGGREPGRQLVEDHYAAEKKSGKYKGCDTYVDFRELIARKDIDAVVGQHARSLACDPGRHGGQGPAKTSTARSRSR